MKQQQQQQQQQEHTYTFEHVYVCSWEVLNQSS